MEASTPQKTPDAADPATGNPAVTPPAQTIVASATESANLALPSVKYLSDKLEEAELLLGYAAELGIKLDDGVRDAVLEARIASQGGTLAEPTAANLLAALTTLAENVRPVTVQSLKDCANSKDARATIRFFGSIALVCAFLIVLFSLAAFVSNHFADQIKTDVTTANDLALKLQAELGPSSTNQPEPIAPAGSANLTTDQIWWGTNQPPAGLTDKDVLNDLRQFAATMREIDGLARQLNHFVFDTAIVPYAESRTNRAKMKQKFELTSGLPYRLSWEFATKVGVYQDVRDFGNSVAERVTIYYGAFATCILPVLYALLGAGAYLLRLYESQIKNRTYTAGDRHVARFLTAGIGGLVVGQFNFTQGVTISPFAVAFLVGYAVDVFFAFLDSSLQIFKRNPATTAAQGIPPKPPN